MWLGVVVGVCVTRVVTHTHTHTHTHTQLHPVENQPNTYKIHAQGAGWLGVGPGPGGDEQVHARTTEADAIRVEVLRDPTMNAAASTIFLYNHTSRNYISHRSSGDGWMVACYGTGPHGRPAYSDAATRDIAYNLIVSDNGDRDDEMEVGTSSNTIIKLS